MSLTLLEICEEALEGTGIDPPNAIIGGDDLAQQLLRLMHVTGRDIRDKADWQLLVKEATFTTSATEEQAVIATSWPYLHKIIDNTMWNRTQQRRVLGPLSPQAWQSIKARGVVPNATLYYRIRGGSILMPGTPTAGETVAFEYRDKRWISDSTGSVLRERFEADNDLVLLSDDTMILGLAWRFRAEKGLEYGEKFREYQDSLSERIGNDKPAETLYLDGARSDYLETGQIPDGNWTL